MTRRTRRITWRVDVGRLEFRVVTDSDRCAASARSAVLIHGIGMSHRYMSRLHDALRMHATVFSIDLPGHAGLPKPKHDIDIETMSNALGKVIDTLKVGPVLLIGHSMGTQWGVELGIQRPDLVAQLVTIGPVVDVAHRTVPAQIRALAKDTLRESPAINAIVFTDYLRCGVVWYLAQLRHMIAYPLEQRVADLSVPTLIIRGERDPIARLTWCGLLRDQAPTAALVSIPRQTHVAQYSSPGAVASAILAFTVGASERPS